MINKDPEMENTSQLLLDCKCLKHYVSWQNMRSSNSLGRSPILIFDDVSFALKQFKPIRLTFWQKVKRWIKNNILKYFKQKNNETRIVVSSHCFVCGKGWRFHSRDTYWDHSEKSYG